MRIKIRTLLGAIITVVWLIGLAFILQQKGGLSALLALSLNEIGDFLAGAFAPLAFIWFVIAYAQQGDELRQNTAALSAQHEEMEKSAEQSAIQTKAIKANLALASDQSKIAKRNLFIVTAEPILAELREIGIVLYEKCEAASSEWVIRRRAWKDRFDAGDEQIIFRGLADYFNSGSSDALFAENLKQSEVKSAIVRYMECFEILLRNASASEFDDFDMADFYRYSNYGKLYRALEKHHSAGLV